MTPGLPKSNLNIMVMLSHLHAPVGQSYDLASTISNFIFNRICSSSANLQATKEKAAQEKEDRCFLTLRGDSFYELSDNLPVLTP